MGLTRCGALWRHTDKHGKGFYSGKVDVKELQVALEGGCSQVFIFPVKEKRDRGPDIELFVAPDERAQPAKPKPSIVEEDEIPFAWLLPLLLPLAMLGGLLA